MRHLFSVLVCVGLLTGSSWAQPSAALLARRVRVAATEAPLQQVLRDIARQSGVPFSYSSTFIPLQRRVTLHTKGARPVGEVLQQLFQGRGVSYQVIGGQIVLWRTGEKPPFAPPGPPKPAAATSTAKPASMAKAKPAALPARLPAPTRNPVKTPKRPGLAGYKTGASAAASVVTASTRPAEEPRPTGARPPATAPMPPLPLPAAVADTTHLSVAADTTTQEARKGLARLRQKARAKAQAATGALARTAQRAGRTVGIGAKQVVGDAKAVLDTVAVAATELREPLREGARRLTTAARRDTLAGRAVAVQSSLPTRDTVLAPVPVAPSSVANIYDHHTWQASFITPLGTNGLRSGRSINDFSLNVLAGYSAGVRGAEVGGIINVVRDTMLGVQAAGIVNLTGTEVRGVQAAGIVNVAGGSVRGIQAAGIVNLVRDDARGVQVAGLVNIVGGAARSRRDAGRPALARQVLGLPRLLATDSAARRLAAPSALSLPGPLVQAAGLVNLTGTDIRGLQTAPVLNMARRVHGLQLGLVNVAKHVDGVQFGLINIADSVDGATLGIINIVRHGYLHGEVWASETLPLNAALKLGTTRYYTILSAATQPFGSRVHWATGLGIGTASRQHGRFSWNLDLLDWYLLKQPGSEGTLLSYTQLRPSLVWQIEPQGHLGLVVSPTLNMGLYENDGGGTKSDFGKNQLLLVDTKSGRTLVRLWPGVQIGLRF
ncbi:STN domain-containing protein [Hymenobacter sp. BT635]|uniref:STN domain-containing protein n=1 Tax=Hymenobacter nitidus TaxID=2880929 RepID=A0ABS8AER1_9BACT|nr:STN domain-containing protein [Hymenobacter nitidus]MCB2378878.1 STN domain-containing protein [Hymenobacter nitidus]